jgi:acyl carrier protein
MSILHLLREMTDLNIDDLDSSTELSSITGWDSLAMVRLAVGLEEHLGRELDIEELTSIVYVSDVEKLLPSSQ